MTIRLRANEDDSADQCWLTESRRFSYEAREESCA